MDFDNQPNSFYRYDGLGGLTDAELSPTDNAMMGSLNNTTYLVRLKDDSFLLVSARNKLEVREQVSRITNPNQTIITPFNQNFVLEFSPKIRPIQHIRDGPIVLEENIPDFNFLDMCMTKTFSDAQIACTIPEIKKKGRVVQIPVHCMILRRWDFFKNVIDKRNTKKKKKKGGGGHNHPNQNLLTIRDLKTFSKQNVEIVLRYSYSPKLTPYEWIPENEKDELVKNTDLFFELLKLSKKVNMFSLYQRLCHFFIKERLKNCDLTLPVYTSYKNDPKYEDEKEHFEDVFFEKRFTINAKKILKVWEEVKGKGVDFVENYIAVYLLEHCVGHPQRLKVLAEEHKDILEYKGVKYYMQKNDMLLNLGRREFDSPLESSLKNKKKKNKKEKKDEDDDRPKMMMMDENDLDDDPGRKKKKVEFPYELSVCGDFNFDSFHQFKKSMYPKLHKVEKEIVDKLYKKRDEAKIGSTFPSTKTSEKSTTIRNISSERKREKEMGKKLRKAWIREKESVIDYIRRQRKIVKEEESEGEEAEEEEDEDNENHLSEEYLDLLGNEDLMNLQMKSNRFLLPRSEYKDIFDDSDSEESSDEGEEEEETKQIDPKNPICAVKACGKTGTKRCTRCKLVFYCSRECQVKDWKLHKKKCIPKK